MAFAHLLTPTKFIELHNGDRAWILKIRNRRVIEGQMAILTNAQAAQVNRLRVEKIGIWTPDIDGTTWPNNRVFLYSTNEPELFGVVQTDCIVWAIRSDLVAYLRSLDYSPTPLGWGIDWAADRWSPVHTRPWGLVVFFVFGAAAGILNVMRAAREINGQVAKKD